DVFEVIAPLLEAAGAHAILHGALNHGAAQRRGIEANGLLKQRFEIVHEHGASRLTLTLRESSSATRPSPIGPPPRGVQAASGKARSRDICDFTPDASAGQRTFLSAKLRSDWHDSRPAGAKLGLDLVLQPSSLGLATENGKSRRAAPGHEGRRHALRAQELLKEREQRVFFQRWRFEGVVEFAARLCKMRRFQQFDEFARAVGLAAQRCGKPNELLVGPRRTDSEPRMDEQERGFTQSRKRRKRLNAFAASRRQRRLVLKEKGHVRAEPRREFLELPGRKRRPEKFVQSEQCRRSVATASTQAGGQRDLFLQVDADAFAHPGSLK